MSKQIELPQLGESVETGTVLSLLVAEGDHVEEQQGLIEVETDKATTEIPSPRAGIVEEIHVGEGDEVTAGQAILTLGSEEDADADDDVEDTVETEDTESDDTG